MTSIPEVPETETREELIREAERARARLLTTIETLEQRGQDVIEIPKKIEAHMVSAGTIAMVAAGGAVAIAMYRAADMRKHRGRERIRALQRMWRHPERTVEYEPRPMIVQIARKVALAALSMVAVDLTKKIVRQIVASQQPLAASVAVSAPLLAHGSPGQQSADRAGE